MADPPVDSLHPMMAAADYLVAALGRDGARALVDALAPVADTDHRLELLARCVVWIGNLDE